MIARPYISRESVVRHLDALLYDSQSEFPADLHGLLIVDQRVSDLPRADLDRDYAVRDLLADLILNAYFAVRRALELPLPSLNLPLSAVADWVRADAAPRNPELLAWSLLYHRYIRADLNLTAAQLADLISAADRTFRRYQAYAVRLLTYRLIHAETQARTAKKRRYLQLSLPAPVPLLGRAADLAAAEHLLTATQPAHLLISGVPGVGKSVFAADLMRRCIDADRVDAVLWFDQPSSVQAVLDHLTDHLLPEGVDLAERLHGLRLGVVLDDISALTPHLDALLRLLSSACVLMTHVAHLPLDVAHFTLRDLAASDAETLVRDLLYRHSAADAPDYRAIAAYLYERVGGHPDALKALLLNWAFEDGAQLEARVLHQFFGRLFETLPVGAQMAWCALAVVPRLPWDTLLEFAVTPLLRHHLAERQGADALLSVHGARELVLRSTAPAVSAAFAALIASVSTLSAPVVYPLAEHILAENFPPLPLDQRVAWCRRFCLIGLERGRHGRWRAILEDLARLAPLDVQLRTLYGVILRRLGAWDAAQTVFIDAATELGRAGKFRDQAYVLLEWSIAAKYQGHYQQALDLIAQARKSRQSDAELRLRLTLLEAQILVESGDGVRALHLLDSLHLDPLHPDSSRVLMVTGEAHLALGAFAASRRHAEAALATASPDLLTHVSLYTTIGRTYEGEGQLELAESYFTRVVSLLEQADDPYALARAQTNLAALLIKMRTHGREHAAADARQLLTAAETTQTRLGDQVGLMTTRHNRSILHNA